MSTVNDEEVISFPIRFTVDPQNVDDVKEAIDEGADEEALDLLNAEDGTPIEGVDAEALKQMADFIKTTDKAGLQALTKYAKNPSGAIGSELIGLLGKAGIPGIIATAILGILISTPEMIITIAKALSVKGGPLNQDFHRFFADETQLGFSREVQYRKAVGLDVVITNQERGFLLTDPDFVTNSLLDIDTTRSIRTSDRDNVYGYVGSM